VLAKFYENEPVYPIPFSRLEQLCAYICASNLKVNRRAPGHG